MVHHHPWLLVGGTNLGYGGLAFHGGSCRYARVYFHLPFISVAQLYSPYILGYGTAGLSGGKAGWTLYECVDCGNKYKHKGSLQRHIKYECRKQPSFKCPYCVYRAYQKHNLLLHERHLHKDMPEKVDFVSE